LPYEHPLFVGHPGPRANRSANFAIQSADVIVSMGCSLHIQTVGYEGELFAPNAIKVQIDIDSALLEREHIGADWKFGWDLHDYLPMLAGEIKEPWTGSPNGDWPSLCREWKENYSSRSENHRFGEADDLVNLYEFVDCLSDALTGNETILTDAGQPHPILAQAFRLKNGQRYINPGSLAEMGYALPASLGIAAASPGKQIIAIFGDGSLQTNIQELQTLKHHGFNIKIFVINNDGYASIRNTQKTFFNGFFVGSTPSSGVTLPETEKICSAYGLRYLRCNCRGELAATVSAALAAEGPVVCEVMAQLDQKILPVVPSALLPDGSMRSKSLEEMVPDIGVTLAEISKSILAGDPRRGG
jgi:acetolactate synthase-1/2/3 large subunit